MKNHFSTVSKLVAVAVCALSLGSCSRAEYAMLPKGASYHGVARATTPVLAATVAPATVVTETAAAPAVAAVPTKAVQAPAVVVATPAAKAVAVVPAATTTAPAAVAVTTTTAAAAPKLTLVQRMAMSKVMHKMDKMAQKSGLMRSHDNTASTTKTTAISGNLRTGLILLLVGLLVSLFSGINGIFALVGGIIAIIGLVFIILWLLDQA